MRVRAVMAAATLVAAVALGVAPAVAGGSHLSPVRDRHEVGEVATLVGYTGGPMLDAHRAPGPYRAFLADEGGAALVEVGRLELTDWGRRGWDSLRVAIRFTVPAVPPGSYAVTYCLGACERPAQLGDLIGGFLAVGVDPPFPPSREWPLDEPEIANLAAGAILTGPGYRTTAGEVRAGGRLAPAKPLAAAPPTVVPVTPAQAPPVTAVVPPAPVAPPAAPATVAPVPPAPAASPPAPVAPPAARPSWSGWAGLGSAGAAAGLVLWISARRRRALGQQGPGRLDALAPVGGSQGGLGRGVGADVRDQGGGVAGLDQADAGPVADAGVGERLADLRHVVGVRRPDSESSGHEQERASSRS